MPDNKKQRRWRHDELAADLAGHLRTDHRMVWQDMQLGPSGSPRPDVYTIDKSYTRPNQSTYETKVTVSDFRSDVTSGKWQKYLAFSTRVFFAVPRGLIKKADLPPGCGLIVRGDTGWRVHKKPVVRPVELGQLAWLKLLIDGLHREGHISRRRAGLEARAQAHAARLLGDDIAMTLQNAAYAAGRLERLNADFERERSMLVQQAQREVEAIKSEAPDSWRKLCEVLDMPIDSRPWLVRHKVDELRHNLSGDAHLATLTRFAGEVDRLNRRLQAAVSEGECK